MMSEKNKKKAAERMRLYWKNRKNNKSSFNKDKIVFKRGKNKGRNETPPITITPTPAAELVAQEEEEVIQEEAPARNLGFPKGFTNPFDEKDEETNNRRIMPESDLELNYFFTNPQWGDDSVNSDLQKGFEKTRLRKIPKGGVYVDADGNAQTSDGEVKTIETTNHWHLLQILTRDMRLANYTPQTHHFCAYMYSLGGSILDRGYKQAAAVALLQGAVEGEMSQGDGGFLRKIQNTIIKKEEIQQMEIKKNNILGKPNKTEFGQGGY